MINWQLLMHQFRLGLTALSDGGKSIKKTNAKIKGVFFVVHVKSKYFF
jgi:hypothetical protein